MSYNNFKTFITTKIWIPRENESFLKSAPYSITNLNPRWIRSKIESNQRAIQRKKCISLLKNIKKKYNFFQLWKTVFNSFLENISVYWSHQDIICFNFKRIPYTNRRNYSKTRIIIARDIPWEGCTVIEATNCRS